MDRMSAIFRALAWRSEGSAILTAMSEADRDLALAASRAARLRRADNGRDDRKLPEALHHLPAHKIA